MSNHLQLLVEAENGAASSSGMRSFAIARERHGRISALAVPGRL